VYYEIVRKVEEVAFIDDAHHGIMDSTRHGKDTIVPITCAEHSVLRTAYARSLDPAGFCGVSRRRTCSVIDSFSTF
jgi:hypothetical protein